MDIFSSIILGFIQGITEFLPISSSGHLIVVREFLNIETSLGLSFDAVLQLATSIAVLVYFRHEFIKLFFAFIKLITRKVVDAEEKVLMFAIILGTIPAVIFGLFLEESMETTFRSTELVALSLLAGSVLFLVAEKVATQSKELTVKKGVWIGFFQVLALLPGMSRSGSTIAGGLLFGLTREKAARFSFLLSFPVIFGSGMKKLLELNGSGLLNEIGVSLLSGAITAFIVGLFAIHYLLKYLRNHTLNIFIVYRVILAFIILIFLV